MSSRKAKRRLSDNGDDAAPDEKRRIKDDPNDSNEANYDGTVCKISSENTIFEKLSPTFKGINGASRLVVFGDSYSNSQSDEASGGDQEETWIQILTELSTVKIVDNFAVPGDTAESDLARRVSLYLKSVPKKPLDSTKTYHVIWIGTNDCGQTDVDDLPDIVEHTFDQVDKLYFEGKAINFLFIDVPPVHRSPGALQGGVEEEMKDRCQTWNDLLASRVRDFAQGSSKANVLLFSANKWLSGLLDDPQAYGFSTEDVSKEDGAIWTDNLHLTSAIHRLLGRAVYDALCVNSVEEAANE